MPVDKVGGTGWLWEFSPGPVFLNWEYLIFFGILQKTKTVHDYRTQ